MRCLLLLLCCQLVSYAHAEIPHWVQPDDVHVTRLGEGFRVEIEMQAPVPPALAWQVLTDFANMARFAPNLESSRIVERQGNVLKIEQVGIAHFGPFSQHFTSVREISLNPQREILARQLSGTARRMESRMRVSALVDGARLEYRAEIVPDTPLPPLFGPSFVRHEMAEQFSAMINEMAKRQAGANKEPPPAVAGAASK